MNLGQKTEALWQRTFGEALECGQGLATVALLNTNVDIVGLGSDVLVGGKRVTLVCEGICGVQREVKEWCKPQDR